MNIKKHYSFKKKIVINPVDKVFGILIMCLILYGLFSYWVDFQQKAIQPSPVNNRQQIGLNFVSPKSVKIIVVNKPLELIIMTKGIELQPNSDGIYTLAPDDIHTIFITSSTTIRYFTIEELETIQIKIGF